MWQQQDAPLLPRAALMTAVAHPTPAFTVTAPVGQFLAQAPHSMHASRSAITTAPPARPRTARGQTSRQAPQPEHRSVSSLSVTTFSRYIKAFTAPSQPAHRDPIQHPSPQTIPVTAVGTVHRTSFLTPESDVNDEAPVKRSAR